MGTETFDGREYLEVGLPWTGGRPNATHVMCCLDCGALIGNAYKHNEFHDKTDKPEKL